MLLASALLLVAGGVSATAQPAWQVGDVFVGVGEPNNRTYGGKYFIYTPAGEPKATITTGSPLADPAREYTTGCSVDPFTGRLWGTNFYANHVIPFDDGSPSPATPVINTQSVIGPGNRGYESATESVLFGIDREGRQVLYVGTLDSALSAATQKLLKYSAKAQTVGGISYTAGQLLATYDLPNGIRGIDWFDISSDGSTVFYTSEDGQRLPSGVVVPAQIRVFDLSSNQPKPAIIVHREDGSTYENIIYAVRILPPGDGSGGFLVATQLGVIRLANDGLAIDQYNYAREGGYFALNLTPDGKSFWTAQLATGDDKVMKFAINGVDPATGQRAPQVVIRPGAPLVAGLCVKLEPTALLGCPVLGADGQPVIDPSGRPQYAPCPRLESCPIRNADHDGDGLPSQRDPDCVLPLEVESCNGLDDDLDAIIDEGCARTNTEGDTVTPFSVVNLAAAGTSPTIVISGLPMLTGAPPVNAGTIGGTLAPGSAGVYEVVVSVTRRLGSAPPETSTGKFSWTVIAQAPPEIQSPGAIVAVRPGEQVVVPVVVVDPNGDSVTVTIGGDLPPGVTYDAASRTFVGQIGASFTGPLTTTITATDTRGGVATHTFVWTGNRPPVCPTGTGNATLWPPNHKLVPFKIGSPGDPDGDALHVSVTVAQDEPTQTAGDGNTVQDAFVNGLSVLLRAERSGTPKVPGNGRVYTVTLTATDHAGASCTATWTVAVPHDAAHPAVNDGGSRLYNSLTGARIH